MRPLDRPNVLLITTDEQRADHVGFGGDPVVRTPHLDALAESGVTFDRAYVANPTCMPNRASIVTGRLPSSHGTRVNGLALDRDAQTFARVLRRDGYRTALIGKAHLQPLGHGADEVGRLLSERPGGDAVSRGWPAGWDTLEWLERHREGWVDVGDNYYGFDHVRLTGGISAAAGGHYLHWLRQQGVDPSKRLGPANARWRSSLWDQVFMPDLPAELSTTSYITDRTSEFMSQAVAAGKPFLAWCSFPDPHHPFAPPPEYFDRYRPDEVGVPESFADRHERSMPHIRKILTGMGAPNGPFQVWAPTEAQLREALAAQYGSIEQIDDAVGRLLRELDRLGVAENTVVVFTSDHGDMGGDHGLLLKHAVHYEACIRVPLVVRVPGTTPGRCSSLVSSLDIAPSILELTGSGGYGGIQGRSLLPLIDNPGRSLRDALLIEEDQIFGVEGLPAPIRMRTVVTDRFRYTRYAGQQHGELFDRSSDPAELDNIFGMAAAGSLQRELTERLVAELLASADEARAPTHMA